MSVVICRALSVNSCIITFYFDLKGDWPIKIKIVVVSQSDSEVHKSQSTVLTAIRARNETAMNFSYCS